MGSGEIQYIISMYVAYFLLLNKNKIEAYDLKLIEKVVTQEKQMPKISSNKVT